MNVPPHIHAAWIAACDVRVNAHCPYSNYRVGAALTAVGHPTLFEGCNVENASYGATICAERNAIFAAVTALGTFTIRDLVLVTEQPAPPCGMCLQVITEFADTKTRIYLATAEKITHTLALVDLLPHQFDPSHLDTPHD
ncbi:MAG: cytidine deaminase [Kiritimatiellae bacterium]|jgi:cytidine deaminase|nr:cytidine deaminase [Kiritimatiellia bacterium]